MIDIKIKLEEGGTLPTKGTDEAACYDVVARWRKFKDDYIEYGLGFSTEIPKGWEGIIRPRSSISNYDLVMCNSIATIDSDFRGEWRARFKIGVAPGIFDDLFGFKSQRLFTPNDKPIIYEIGEKVAQITFNKVEKIIFLQDEELAETARGDGGFGSTGK